jgi:hypothetical protein
MHILQCLRQWAVRMTSHAVPVCADPSRDHVRLLSICSGWNQAAVTSVPSHILGKVPLVLAGDTCTIPRSMHGRKETCYPIGVCDSAGAPGSGSPLLYINSWALISPVNYQAVSSWEMNNKKTFCVDFRVVYPKTYRWTHTFRET